ncbi:26S proteasome non-ATPase regulatory subunit 1, partial [Fragariocoptes setiger]
MKITSASGFISLLDENGQELQEYALHRLNDLVDKFWPEISEAIVKIESLCEDKSFRNRNLAALLASKIYYHLGSFDDCLAYAISANHLFDINQQSEYVDTIISKCMDQYAKLRLKNLTHKISDDTERVDIDPRLEDIVNRMFERCFVQQQYKQVLGLALETRRMDVFERSITESNDVAGMLNHAFKVCMSLLENRQFRDEILRILVRLYRNLEKPDYINMIQCLIFLDDADSVGAILNRLTSSANADDYLMAYQIAFDLYESGTQQYLIRVIQSIRAYAPVPNLVGAMPDASGVNGTDNNKPEGGESGATTPSEAAGSEAEDEAQMDVDDAINPTKGGKKRKTVSTNPSSSEAVAKTSSELYESLSELEKVRQERLMKLAVILNGETTIELQLQFMIRKNHADLLILKHTKDSVRNTICHSATVIANGLMHYGTTSDAFLRENLEWLGRAVNWAKFTATASLGVIHHGHEKDGLHLLDSYLPKTQGGNATSGYTEGGALFALGLIYANHGLSIIDYLLNQLRDASNEAIRHGACLGVGLAAMGTNRIDIYDQLKFNLYQDDAVTGEAAGIAMGLVMLGSNSLAAITDMLSYAQETQHEKILRGLSIGIGLMMFGCMEQADEMIASLESNKDALLRRAAMHAISLAYCGSGNNRAIAKLLHVAVSDVNDDVRRAAVCGIGFILFRNPEQCPNVVSLLSESYNPHVRCGAAMAIGICCAGSGSKEAISILEPMINDSVNFVRQGALVASALVLIQQTDVLNPKVKEFRQLYAKVIADKHDDVMAKFGAILAQGIIDAGARNVTVSLQSRTGHTNVRAVVGMLVFTQFWYWYPLTHFLSLAFTPTYFVGLNADLKIPKLEIRSNAKPSTFAYPPPIEEKKEREREKVSTAILSITAKAKKKEANKKDKQQGEVEKMEVDEEPTSKSNNKAGAKADGTAGKASSNKNADVKAKQSSTGEGTSKDPKDKPAKAAAKDEPSFEMLTNPARVLRQQLKVIQMPEGSRYVPIKDISIGGIILMKDTRPDEPEELVEPVIAHGSKAGEEKEPEPPEPFEYNDD